MPAYNAEKTLELTYKDIPPGSVDEIILVDDCSKDRTVEIAKSLGLTVIQHEMNMGYGANQKTCYREALKRGADIVVMLHPDYQYDSRLIPYLIEPLKDKIYDIMLGSRIRTRQEAISGGMPLYKYVANRFLTLTENIILGQNLSEFHTGFRAYTRKVLATTAWENNSNDFVFDSEFLIQSIYCKFKIGETAVPARYFPEASSIKFWRSSVYGCSTLFVLAKYLLQKRGIMRFSIFEKK